MSVHDAEIITQRIDQYWEDNQEDGRRGHLGGSLIGRECMRELWYSFRWASVNKFKGRILRLFDRGHKEEFRFVEYLTQIGVEVREYSQSLWWSPSANEYSLMDWDANVDGGIGDYENVTTSEHHVKRAKKYGVKLTQWRIKDIDGHLGGSTDGMGINVPGVDLHSFPLDEPVLLEMKTHGEKSFLKLVKEGLKEAKPEHYSQMQIYMHKMGLRIGLYMAVNKTTDELKCFFVIAEPMVGAGLISKGGEIISSPQPLKRMSNNPSWFKCRFCDHRKTCHLGEPMAINCRTCAMSKPIEDGEWHCAKWQCVIPLEGQKQGCDAYHAITD